MANRYQPAKQSSSTATPAPAPDTDKNSTQSSGDQDWSLKSFSRDLTNLREATRETTQSGASDTWSVAEPSLAAYARPYQAGGERSHENITGEHAQRVIGRMDFLVDRAQHGFNYHERIQAMEKLAETFGTDVSMDQILPKFTSFKSTVSNTGASERHLPNNSELRRRINRLEKTIARQELMIADNLEDDIITAHPSAEVRSQADRLKTLKWHLTELQKQTESGSIGEYREQQIQKAQDTMVRRAAISGRQGFADGFNAHALFLGSAVYDAQGKRLVESQQANVEDSAIATEAMPGVPTAQGAADDIHSTVVRVALEKVTAQLDVTADLAKLTLPRFQRLQQELVEALETPDFGFRPDVQRLAMQVLAYARKTGTASSELERSCDTLSCARTLYTELREGNDISFALSTLGTTELSDLKNRVDLSRATPVWAKDPILNDLQLACDTEKRNRAEQLVASFGAQDDLELADK
jgi:uncharacterized coiled-coil protein SlyX